MGKLWWRQRLRRQRRGDDKGRLRHEQRQGIRHAVQKRAERRWTRWRWRWQQLSSVAIVSEKDCDERYNEFYSLITNNECDLTSFFFFCDHYFFRSFFFRCVQLEYVNEFCQPHALFSSLPFTKQISGPKIPGLLFMTFCIIVWIAHLSMTKQRKSIPRGGTRPI